MSTDHQIKVIKLTERKRRAKARIENDRESSHPRGQDEVRDATATVTGWVDDLRRQKHQSADALSIFNSLFEDLT
ncbi:MAG TPA: hypothetical protein VGB73_13385 [Pyrinomonadaceae bacterium]|jgi:hypothetical protein